MPGFPGTDRQDGVGGSGNVPFDGQVGDEGLDFLRAHVFGVALVVEENVTRDPVFVCFFGAGGVMFNADGVADLIEEFFSLWRRRSLRWRYGLGLHIFTCLSLCYNFIIVF